MDLMMERLSCAELSSELLSRCLGSKQEMERVEPLWAGTVDGRQKKKYDLSVS